jgi:hypothetical protein
MKEFSRGNGGIRALRGRAAGAVVVADILAWRVLLAAG